MGSVATVTFAAFGLLDVPLVAGGLLGLTYFFAAPANAVLLAAQMSGTPQHLQGRVMAASFLGAGLAAPIGPPISGFLLDRTNPVIAFSLIAGVTAVVTLAVLFTRAMRPSLPTSGPE